MNWVRQNEFVSSYLIAILLWHFIDKFIHDKCMWNKLNWSNKLLTAIKPGKREKIEMNCPWAPIVHLMPLIGLPHWQLHNWILWIQTVSNEWADVFVAMKLAAAATRKWTNHFYLPSLEYSELLTNPWSSSETAPSKMSRWIFVANFSASVPMEFAIWMIVVKQNT